MANIASKEKPIGDVLRVMLLTALNFIESALLKRIESEKIDTGLSLVIARLRQVVVALNDADANNRAQVLQIVLDFLNQDLSTYAKEILLEEIEKITDENLKKILLFALNRSVDILLIFTDVDKDNKSQMNEFFELWRRSDETHDILLYSILQPLLEKTNLAPDWIEGILEVIKIALKGDSGDAAAVAARLRVS